MECCQVTNNIILMLTNRINYIWNNIYLLFTTNEEIEPGFIKTSNTFVSII